MVQPLYINEDNLFTWDKAKRRSTGAYINSGTGSWALKDEDGVSLATGSLAYATASNGKWQGTVDKLSTAGLVLGSVYYVELTLTDGSGADGFRRIECVADYHGGT